MLFIKQTWPAFLQLRQLIILQRYVVGSHAAMKDFVTFVEEYTYQSFLGTCLGGITFYGYILEYPPPVPLLHIFNDRSLTSGHFFARAERFLPAFLRGREICPQPFRFSMKVNKAFISTFLLAGIWITDIVVCRLQRCDSWYRWAHVQTCNTKLATLVIGIGHYSRKK